MEDKGGVRPTNCLQQHIRVILKKQEARKALILHQVYLLYMLVLIACHWLYFLFIYF